MSLVRIDQILREMLVLEPPPPDSEVAAVMYVDELLDGEGKFQYLDRSFSVSALPESEAVVRQIGKTRSGSSRAPQGS